MPMNQQKSIYQEFYNLEGDDYLGIIRAYERNTVVLDHKTQFMDVSDFNDHILFLTQYIISLENEGKYTKSITYSEKAILLIRANIKQYKIVLSDYRAYWSILTTKGRCEYKLKKYKNASETFEELVNWDPENDYLKNWFESSKRNRRIAINTPLYIIGFALIFMDVIFTNAITPELERTLTKIGFLLILAALINDYVYDRIKKWIDEK